MMTNAFALIDYDNICIKRQERNRIDAQENLHAIADWVARAALSMGHRDVDLRFYGGWLDEVGRLSFRAVLITEALSTVRGRRGGVRLRPQVVTSIAVRYQLTLSGLIRGKGSYRKQKMVDSMITVDAIYLCAGADVIIASDDDDLVPAALASASCNLGRVMLLRSRPEGEGLNDAGLSSAGVRFRHFPGRNGHEL